MVARRGWSCCMSRAHTRAHMSGAQCSTGAKVLERMVREIGRCACGTTRSSCSAGPLTVKTCARALAINQRWSLPSRITLASSTVRQVSTDVLQGRGGGGMPQGVRVAAGVS